MNKAFVREPDNSGEDLCPRCGSVGVLVRGPTLAAHLPPDELQAVSDPAFFCPWARCEVAYFDAFERTVAATKLLYAVYPKDPAAPLCRCFGLTCDDIEADIREGGVRRVRELLEKARSPQARCTTASPSGQSCVSEVQRYYLQLRGQAR